MTRSKGTSEVVYDKIQQEQFKDDEQEAIQFLKDALNLSISGDLHKHLKDGVYLCKLINKLKPGTIKHIGKKDLLFFKMDNITSFLQGARQLGLNEFQLFRTTDLLEAKDMPMVVHTIVCLSKLYEKLKAAEKETETETTSDSSQKDIFTDKNTLKNASNETKALMQAIPSQTTTDPLFTILNQRMPFCLVQMNWKFEGNRTKDIKPTHHTKHTKNMR
ncbi:calponin homology domain-containing protein [Spinellus fusiger]|nr:calponin homology domain-containing protein [Spinellus fusiger]